MSRTGRQSRFPEFTLQNPRTLRSRRDDPTTPHFDQFIEFLKKSKVIQIPIKSVAETIQSPVEVAVLQEEVSSLAMDDKWYLKQPGSLDELLVSWNAGIELAKSLDYPSRDAAGTVPPGDVTYHPSREGYVIEERRGSLILEEKFQF